MKLSLQLKLIGFIPIVMILGFSSYLVYEGAKNYGKTLEIENNVKDARELTKLVKNLALERGMSSLYVNSKGTLAKESLEKQRLETSAAIESYKNYSNNVKQETFFHNLISNVFNSSINLEKDKYKINNNRIFENIKDLESKRRDIDSLNVNFNEIFNVYFEKMIKDVIVEMQKTHIFPSNNAKLEELLLELNNIVNSIEGASQERGFLTKPLTSSTKLQREDLNRWFSLWVVAEKYPKVDGSLDKQYYTEISNILNNQENKELIQEVLNTKLDILEEAFKGVYPIEAPLWFLISTEKISVLEKLQDVIFKYSNDELGKELNAHYMSLMVNILVWIFTVILAILGTRTSRLSENNLNKFENLFKEVIKVTSDENSVDIDLNSQNGVRQAYFMIEQAIKTAHEDSEAAKEASLTKSLFLANMSHEIRTPLNGIIGFTNLLKNTNIDEEQEEFINIIEKSGKNLLEIISNILDLSKIESNKVDIEHIEFSPFKEFESAVEIYAAKASEKNIDLNFFIDPELPPILKGDPTKIQQVLVNLMSNAIKFTPLDGNINVEIKKLNEQEDGTDIKKIRMSFSVEDTGPGIPKNKKETIFESFSQADSSITRQFGGTGLGLTISREFIGLMGGKLDVESEVGKGSKFFFIITLDTNVSNNSEYKNEFNNLLVDVLVNTKQEKKSDKYIKEYLTYLGIKPNLVSITNNDWIKEINNSSAEFVLINYDIVKDCAPNCLMKLNKKMSFYAKNVYQQELYQLGLDNVFKVVYEPMNFSKTIKLVEEFNETKGQVKIVKETKKQLVIDKFKANVLVCEDNPINQKLIKRTLEDLGCVVDLADNGLIGFDKFKNNHKKYDIIYMDIQMPVMNGVEATIAIKSYSYDNGIRTIPIIALTANALKGDKEKFISMGLDDYTSKPLIINEIIAIMHRFLADKIMTEDEIATIENKKTKIVKKENKVTDKEQVKINVVEDEIADTQYSKLKIALVREKELAGKVIKKFLNNLGIKEENIDIYTEINDIKNKEFDFIFADEILSNGNVLESLKEYKNSFKNTKIIGFNNRNELSQEFSNFVLEIVKSNANKKELETAIIKYM